MSHVPHELAADFPDQVAKLQALKTENAHFARIADEYHDVNREIHRIEAGIEPAADVREVELRKRRITLKDEIAGMLAKA